MHAVSFIASLRYGIRTDLSNRMAPLFCCIGTAALATSERLSGNLCLRSNETLCSGRYGPSRLPAQLQTPPQRVFTSVDNANNWNVNINIRLMKSFRFLTEDS